MDKTIAQNPVQEHIATGLINFLHRPENAVLLTQVQTMNVYSAFEVRHLGEIVLAKVRGWVDTDNHLYDLLIAWEIAIHRIQGEGE